MAREITTLGPKAKDERRKSLPGFRPSSFVFRLQDELAALLTMLGEWQFWLPLLVGVVAWTGAFQVPYTYAINFGGDKLSETRRYDEPFTKGWNRDPEPAGDEWLNPKVVPFRWTFDKAELRLPGLGVGQWDVSLLAAGQPTVFPTISTWSDGVISNTVILQQQPRVYRQVFNANAEGDLRLQFSTPRYSTLTDRRPLGFVGFNAVVRSIGPQRPPLNQLLLLGACVAAVYLVGRRFTLRKLPMALFSIAAAFVLAVVLAYWRITLTAFTPALAAVLLACYPLGLVLARLPIFVDGGRWTVDDRVSTVYRPSSIVASPIIILILLAFAIRLGGMLHPTIRFSDIGLNANDMRLLVEGAVYQQENLPGELGSAESPYPTGQYLVAAPLQVLFEPGETATVINDQYKFVLKIVNALVDSLVVGLIWLLLRRRDYGQAAALFAAGLYLVPGPAFKSFSVGEFANLSGQAMAMPVIVSLALLGHRLRERWVFATVIVLMLFAMLGHSGVTISVVLLLGYLGVSWMLSGRTFRRVLPLLLIGLAVATLLALFYHSAFLHLFLGQPQVFPQRGIADKLFGEVNRVFGWWGKPVNPLLFGLGAFGVVVMALRPRVSGDAPGIWPVLVAWWGSVLLTIGLLAVRDQTVRWDLFLYPALCLGTGVVLASIWCRGKLGTFAASALFTCFFVQNLVYWVVLIYSQYH